MPRTFEQYADEPSTADKFSQAFANVGQGLGQAIPQYLMGKQDRTTKKKLFDAENAAVLREYGYDISGFQDPKMREAIVGNLAKTAGKSDFLDNIRGKQSDSQNTNDSAGGLSSGAPQSQQQSEDQYSETPPDEVLGWYDELSPSKRQELALIDPQAARALEANQQNRLARDESRAKQKRHEFEADRAYHTQFSKVAHEEADNLRATIPKKVMSLDLARDAVESGDLSYFSPDKLADITGVDAFRTAKGVQLTTASKENLISNINRVSAKAQNLFMEQRMNSMFPKTGQTKESNLTAQTILEGEVEMDQAYITEFDRLSEEDMNEHGFERKDIAKRARNNIKQKEKDIFRRTSYRLKELMELEQGLNEMKPKVGKNVVRGTPLTLAMAKLYKDKFGDDALAVAKKNGYYIPTVEEFSVFQQRPQEFRETL